MNNKRIISVPFMLLGVIFCVCLITANILETKQIKIGAFQLTAGLIVFPISYIINDCLVEVWGFRKARMVIWLGFFMNLIFVTLGFLADLLPAAPYWNNQEGFHAIFGLAPRIVAGSFIAFLAGSFINAYFMSIMKIKNKGRWFSLRAIVSTIAGESVDSLIFFPLALGGVVPWSILPNLIISQIFLKTFYEILALPITIRVVKYIKKIDNADIYDNNISYNVFKIKEL